MATPTRLSELSAPKQALVRLCQSIDYGQILGLVIREQEPQFSPELVVLVDFKLDGDCHPRPESELPDFVLCQEVCRLLDRIDAIGTGRVERVEIRAGIPRRMVTQRKLSENAR